MTLFANLQEKIKLQKKKFQITKIIRQVENEI
jgi:hypothetical protein